MSRKSKGLDADDAPVLTKKLAARARPAREFFAEHGIPIPRPRGRPKLERPKDQVTLRLDPTVIDHFRSGGAGWQTRLNDTLVEFVRDNPVKPKLARRASK
ncbi:MAG: BrnA antitoxin family protein [Cucumibacter sp.]